MREELPHHLFSLFYGQILPRLLVNFIRELGTVVNHLFHSDILQELPVLVAIHAVILAQRAIDICAFVVVSQRHTATLTEFYFHIPSYFPKYCG